MKKFLSIFLILILLSALMVGCSSTDKNGSVNIPDIPEDQNSLPNQNDENNNPVNSDGSEEVGGSEEIVGSEEESNEPIREIIDTPYDPDPEGFIGIAFYPVKEGENYPYDIGEKVTAMEKWKYLYT